MFAAACAMKVDPAELGVYMNGSHESCRALYECSCPELDELVGHIPPPLVRTALDSPEQVGADVPWHLWRKMQSIAC